MKVSVIVPVYNAERRIKACARSILKQSYANISVIFVNDGSQDQSGEILDQIAKRDKRVVVVHQKNGGAMSARCAGISKIPEEGYTTFCDADDTLRPDAIEKLVHLAHEYNADIATGLPQQFFRGYMRRKPNIPPSYSVRRVYTKEEIRTKLLQSYFGITDFHGYIPTKLYRNRLLKQGLEFETPARFFQEDIAFNLQMLFLANRIAVMPDIIYNYRMGGGTGRFMPTFLDDSIQLYQFKIKQIMEHKLPESFKQTAAIELKNELGTWLDMYCQKKGKNREILCNEIQRCCENRYIQEAICIAKAKYSAGIPDLEALVQQKDIDALAEIFKKREKKLRFRKYVKKLIAGC